MEFLEQASTQVILFFVLYGITGAVPFIAALYLLLCRSNAFAPDVTPPVRLRRWATAFFVVATLAHVWWLLFYLYFSDLSSVLYLALVLLDSVLLFTTFAGTLLAMLQNRRQSVWPVLAGMMPFVALTVTYMVYPNDLIMLLATIYILLLGLLFTAYMVFAIRQYERWLNDNYADLENKKVWLSQTVSLICMLLFTLYLFAVDIIFIWLIHFIELVLVGLLLWRVETLPTLSLTPGPSPRGEGSDYSQGENSGEELSTPLHYREEQGGGAVNIDLAQIERLLTEHCVNTQLYLQHDLTLQHLAQAVGTNRSYLSQYFSRQGITYNIYINNQRINHFISRYQELTAAGQSVVAQELAQESGFRSYSTFGRAFMQRTGQSVTAWMRQLGEE